MLERLILFRLMLVSANALASIEGEGNGTGARAGFTGPESAFPVLFGYFVMVLGLFAICLMLLGVIAVIDAI